VDDQKVMIDVAAAGTVLGTLAGWLPTIAAGLAIVWYIVRLLETDTAKAIYAQLRRKGDTNGKQD
jgi:TctA family transporter